MYLITKLGRLPDTLNMFLWYVVYVIIICFDAQ